MASLQSELDELLGVESDMDSPSSRITEPFDPKLIRVAHRTLTIDLLLARIRESEMNLTPDFQRKSGIWNDDAQSRLIESILIRIPLPAFYIDATNENSWVVVDGLQRLTALKRFVLDEQLRLSGLEFLDKEFTGRTYSTLPRPFQRRLLETQVVVFVIEQGTPDAVKFNIFKRINTGGLPLSSQEIRHALNQGPATRLLKRLAESDEFLTATNRSIRDDRMADRECVLRFLAFTMKPYTAYGSASRNDFDGFLNEAMKTLNMMEPANIDHLDAKFRQAMTLARDIFGDHAFRKRSDGSPRRFPINKALFETWAVELGALEPREAKVAVSRQRAICDGFISLLHDREFADSISFGTGDTAKVEQRFTRIKQLLTEVLR